MGLVEIHCYGLTFRISFCLSVIGLDLNIVWKCYFCNTKFLMKNFFDEDSYFEFLYKKINDVVLLKLLRNVFSSLHIINLCEVKFEFIFQCNQLRTHWQYVLYAFSLDYFFVYSTKSSLFIQKSNVYINFTFHIDNFKSFTIQKEETNIINNI